MAPATVGVLALQGDVREHEAVLAALGANTRRVRNPAELAQIDALVIPGGESTTFQLLLETAGLRGPLVAAIGAGMPTLGTCAGMILLANEVLDGRTDQEPLRLLDIAVRRNGYGRQLSSFEAELAADLLGGPMTGVFIRAPRIVRFGETVEVLVTLAEQGAAQPVAVRSGPLIACSFHPELAGETRLHGLLLEAA